jgi:uncharacterized protein with NRDE domain
VGQSKRRQAVTRYKPGVCTIAVALDVHPSLPVILAANRDEYYARAARGPTRLAPTVVGGQDLVAGGTWLALRADGAFAGVTNQRSLVPRDPARRSRGELPLALLADPDRAAADMAALVRALDPADYNGCNLMFGAPGAVWVAYLRPDPPSVEALRLGPGLHVLTNDRLGSPDFPRADRAADLMAPAVRAPWDAAARGLAAALADHARPPDDRVAEPAACAPYGKDLLAALQQVCIHTPAFGTRSSTIAALAPGRIVHYLHADGPPCETRFADAMAVVAEAAS